MQINILGPMQVSLGGDDVTPTAPKLRQLCALLGLQVNAPVSVDQIIEELWQDRPPNSAMTTLQTYIYQLRKLLVLSARPVRGAARPPRDGASAPVRASLRTHAGGYMLELDSGALDWFRFEQMVHRGQGQIAGGSVASGISSLRDGLMIWRGDALCDIAPGSVLRREIVRLDELRRSAMEKRIDAELRLGRHQDLVGELSVLVSRHPTHEGFAARLMTVLNRVGRRTDALGIYQQIRSTLAGELGLEPSDELKRIHHAVLNGDSCGIGSDQVESIGTTGSFDNDTNSDLPGLTGSTELGQEGELDALCTALVTPTRMGALVIGGPGSGKTTFALQAVERVHQRFPDGWFYLRMLDRNPASFQPSEVPLELLRVLGVPEHDLPAEAADRAQMFRRWATTHRALLVLDDVVQHDQVKAAMVPGSTCAVIVVSRRRIYHSALRCVVEMQPVRAESALRLLAGLIGEERIARDLPGARRLVALCQGSLLGLRAAAARLELRPHWTLSDLADRLGERPGGLDELHVDGLDIRNSVEASLTMLTERHRRDLGAIIAKGSPMFTVADVSTELKIDPQRADHFLETLVEAQLMETRPSVDRDLPVRAGVFGAFEYRCRSLVRQVIAESR